MTIAFIINLIIAYSIGISTWIMGNSTLGSLQCVLTGYCLQYFFLSFFFWINAMGFNIWRMFSFMQSSQKNIRGETRQLLVYSVYSQGLPLVICAVTAVVDASKPRVQPHFPNMGDLRCFLGEPAQRPRSYYFESAKFIYFDVFVLVIQLVNLLFFCCIMVVIHRGWKNQADLVNFRGDSQTYQEKFKKSKKQALIVVRLSVILGVPWIFELLSTAVDHEYGPERTKEVVFLADLSTLFAGFLIFLTLVVKKKVLSGLRRQTEELISRKSSVVSTATVTELT